MQIDTLQMVQRSQYLAVWSRLGSYDPADFDGLIYGSTDQKREIRRRLFEYWLHAACIIPLTDYRYSLPRIRYYRDGHSTWNSRWLVEPENVALMQDVYARIQAEGGLRAADFKHDQPRRSSWWDWKPAKRALEVLYDRGEVMIANRINFQRVYDMTERVLPDWVDTTETSEEATLRYYLERGTRALGVCEPLQAADYTKRKRTPARRILEGMVADGTLVEIEALLADGQSHPLVVHRDNLPLLEQAADGALVAARTTFLSPFDTLFYASGRDEQFWGFRQRLEAYKPAPQREWGYFCLPILHQDRMVGRFDPKLERQTGTLRIKAFYLEPGVAPDDELVTGVAAAMRDFMTFHQADELIVERSEPATFGQKLLAAL